MHVLDVNSVYFNSATKANIEEGEREKGAGMQEMIAITYRCSALLLIIDNDDWALHI